MMIFRDLSEEERRGCDYHAIGYEGDRKFKIIYLNRLPPERHEKAIQYLKEQRPEFYNKILLDPCFQEMVQTFNADIPIEFEIKKNEKTQHRQGRK